MTGIKVSEGMPMISDSSTATERRSENLGSTREGSLLNPVGAADKDDEAQVSNRSRVARLLPAKPPVIPRSVLYPLGHPFHSAAIG